MEDSLSERVHHDAIERILEKLHTMYRTDKRWGAVLETQLSQLVSEHPSLTTMLYSAGICHNKSLLYHVCTLASSVELMSLVLDLNPRAAAPLQEAREESFFPSALSTLTQRRHRVLPLAFVGRLGEAAPDAFSQRTITSVVSQHNKTPKPTVVTTLDQADLTPYPHLLPHLSSLSVSRNNENMCFPVETMRQLIQSRATSLQRLEVIVTYRDDDPVEFNFETESCLLLSFPGIRHQDLSEMLHLQDLMANVFAGHISIHIHGNLMSLNPVNPNEEYWWSIMNWISQLPVNDIVVDEYSMSCVVLQSFIACVSRCRTLTNLTMTNRKTETNSSAVRTLTDGVDLSPISQMTQLDSLSFFRSYLGNSLVEPLVCLLGSGDTCLTRLELQWNNMTDDGLVRVVDSLGQNNHTVTILRCNQLEEAPCRILLRHLREYHNCTLERVYDRTKRAMPFKIRQLHSQLRYYCELNKFGRGRLVLGDQEIVTKSEYVTLLEALLFHAEEDHLRYRRTETQKLGLLYGLVRENPIIWAMK